MGPPGPAALGAGAGLPQLSHHCLRLAGGKATSPEGSPEHSCVGALLFVTRCFAKNTRREMHDTVGAL